jgi:hypothetical protein
MEPFIVVTHPEPVSIHTRRVESDRVPADHVAIGFYSGDHLVARGAVPPNAIEPLRQLLSKPVTLALAATQDDDGNIDGRVCVVLPMPEDAEEESEPDEPWKTSIPEPPPGIESGSGPDDGSPRLALLPLGNVVRPARNRRHSDVASDAREMLDNLLSGRGRDAVSRAIDDLLDSI